MTLRDMFADTFSELRRMDKRQCLYQALSFAMIVCTALMLWKSLMLAANTTSPIVVVLSGSMEPAFERGDLLFLTAPDRISTGDIVVFKVDGRDVPIVHRVIKTHQRENGTIKLLTKGDNNAVDDRNLYADGQHWLGREDVVGVARGIVPYLGLITIVMNDYPQVKYGVLGLLAMFMLLNRD